MINFATQARNLVEEKKMETLMKTAFVPNKITIMIILGVLSENKATTLEGKHDEI